MCRPESSLIGRCRCIPRNGRSAESNAERAQRKEFTPMSPEESEDEDYCLHRESERLQPNEFLDEDDEFPAYGPGIKDLLGSRMPTQSEFDLAFKKPAHGLRKTSAVNSASNLAFTMPRPKGPTTWRLIIVFQSLHLAISKILEERLKMMIMLYLESHSHMILKKRSLRGDILAIQLVLDDLRQQKGTGMYMKLRFDYEYISGNIQHEFLWATLASLEINEKSLRLIKALFKDAFTTTMFANDVGRDVRLTRGIRQGSPLTPVLNLLAKEPLMAMLKDGFEEGLIKRLNLGAGTIIDVDYSFFPDDIGLFFQVDESSFTHVRTIIQLYEIESGSTFNYQKSTIYMLGLNDAPDWVKQTGCERIFSVEL
ncbi:hypothetical protein MPTK1_7g07990 [Marchantia polymorpha subsp. ruderalis]|uniref:Reverse transcriptase domain-containing protein n=1 Tax=Marchantia polymorpha subsp. ruderalis TaxID=1480154 RepID=A0AAF6BX95_MARPO|nr:hypothetical protein Mp_7g07990 [Marchantia polymorpha subsp. ruderalis]